MAEIYDVCKESRTEPNEVSKRQYRCFHFRLFHSRLICTSSKFLSVFSDGSVFSDDTQSYTTVHLRLCSVYGYTYPEPVYELRITSFFSVNNHA